MRDFPDYKATRTALELFLKYWNLYTGSLDAFLDDWNPLVVDATSGDEPLYRLVEDRVKCNEDCQSPHPQQRYVQVWPKEH